MKKKTVTMNSKSNSISGNNAFLESAVKIEPMSVKEKKTDNIVQRYIKEETFDLDDVQLDCKTGLSYFENKELMEGDKSATTICFEHNEQTNFKIEFKSETSFSKEFNEFLSESLCESISKSEFENDSEFDEFSYIDIDVSKCIMPTTLQQSACKDVDSSFSKSDSYEECKKFLPDKDSNFELGDSLELKKSENANTAELENKKKR